MIHVLKGMLRPGKVWLRFVYWNSRGWFPWRDKRVYAPRGAHLMREVAYFGGYEPAVLEALRVFARPGTVVIDVGANLGLVSLDVLKSSPEVMVHAYEPSSNSLSHLRKTVTESGYGKRWCLHEVACADRPGSADFHMSSPALGAFDGLAVSGRVPMASSVQVKLVRLDDEWKGWFKPPVSVIKIDVEGAEGRVCAGMYELIAACRPVIIMEWNLVNLEANGADPFELFRIAERHGFKVYDPEALIHVTSLYLVRLLLSRGRDTFLLIPQEMMTHGDGV